MEIDASKGIKVAGFLYKMKTGKRVNERLQEGNFMGRCKNTEHEINVDNSVSASQLSNSIIHEAIHAINEVFATELSESQVKRVANGIHQILEQFDIKFTTKGAKCQNMK